jgi:hypothetical protein
MNVTGRRIESSEDSGLRGGIGITLRGDALRPIATINET